LVRFWVFDKDGTGKRFKEEVVVGSKVGLACSTGHKGMKQIARICANKIELRKEHI
jgi:hypothetical protein